MSDKFKIYFGIGIALFLLVIGIIIFRAGRKKGGVNVSSPVKDNTGVDGASNTEIIQLATSLHTDLDGANLTHDTQLYQRLLALSDTDFIRVNNAFNLLYQLNSGETFKQWIADETVYYVPIFGTQWGTIQQTVLIRLNKLNIT